MTMSAGPSFLHLILLTFVVPCVWFTLNEARYRALSRQRLLVPPLLALTCALLLLLIDLDAGQPVWRSGVFALAGLIIGAVRGLSLKLEVDHDAERIRLPRARGSFMIALVLLGAILLETGGAFVGEPAGPLRQLASEIAAACAAMLIGRAVAIALRWRTTPHADLRRA